MLWMLAFWLTAALLLAPLPFKLVALCRGSKPRPKKVAAEEWANALWLMAGLIPFASFVFATPALLAPWCWQLWLVITLALSLWAPLRSAKLRFAKAQLGAGNARLLAIFSTLLLLPMLVAVFRYAF